MNIDKGKLRHDEPQVCVSGDTAGAAAPAKLGWGDYRRAAGWVKMQKWVDDPVLAEYNLTYRPPASITPTWVPTRGDCG